MNTKKVLKNLERIYNFFLITQAATGGLFYFLITSGSVKPFLKQTELIPPVIIVINTAAVLGAKYFFNLRLKISKELSIESKIPPYKKNSLLILTLLNLVNTVNLFTFLSTGSTIYLMAGGLIILLSFVYRPSKKI